LDDCPAQETSKRNYHLIVVVSVLLTVSILVNVTNMLVAFAAFFAGRLKNYRKKGYRSFEHFAFCKILEGKFLFFFLNAVALAVR